MQALLDTLAEQILQVDVEIALAFRQDSLWAASAERLLSIKGIGPITAGWLLVSTLNFTTCDRPEAMVAYAGLAPNPRQSGSSLRGRSAIGHTGNARLRTAVYLATLSVADRFVFRFVLASQIWLASANTPYSLGLTTTLMTSHSKGWNPVINLPTC
jgi:transposase